MGSMSWVWGVKEGGRNVFFLIRYLIIGFEDNGGFFSFLEFDFMW